jgi:hypothetical protein
VTRHNGNDLVISHGDHHLGHHTPSLISVTVPESWFRALICT